MDQKTGPKLYAIKALHPVENAKLSKRYLMTLMFVLVFLHFRRLPIKRKKRPVNKKYHES
jgi:hypothetical protein